MCSHSSRTLQDTWQWAGLSVALRTGALCSPVWQSVNSRHPWKMEPCSSEGPLITFAPREPARRAALAAATHRRENPLFCPAEPSQPDESCLLLCIAGAGLRDQTQVMEPSLDHARLGLPCGASKHSRRRRGALTGVIMWHVTGEMSLMDNCKSPPWCLLQGIGAGSLAFLLGWCLCRGGDSNPSPS